MNCFKDFEIKPELKNFIGEKIQIKRILNAPITVHDFKIEPSKFEGKGNRLTLQIEKQGEKRVVFTGSSVLMQQIEKVPKDKFPFETTIVNDNEYFEFT